MCVFLRTTWPELPISSQSSTRTTSFWAKSETDWVTQVDLEDLGASPWRLPPHLSLSQVWSPLPGQDRISPDLSCWTEPFNRTERGWPDSQDPRWRSTSLLSPTVITCPNPQSWLHLNRLHWRRRAKSNLREQRYSSHVESKTIKYWIEGTFYWPKNSKNCTEYVPWNSSRGRHEVKSQFPSQ